MNNISCQVCMDLAPLVQDKVASSESRQAVMQHLADCEDCRQIFAGIDAEMPVMDERRVVQKIKRQFSLAALIIVTAGALIGIGIADTHLMFYNILIMPAIGALGYFALKEKSHWVPVVILPLTYAWYLLKSILRGELGQPGLLVSPLFWGLIYAGLCTLGLIVAFLLKFAFTKEDKVDATKI